jgi:hypothetical protein
VRKHDNRGTAKRIAFDNCESQIAVRPALFSMSLWRNLWRDYAASYLVRILFRIESQSLKDHEHIDCFAPAQADSSGSSGSFGKTIAVAGI